MFASSRVSFERKKRGDINFRSVHFGKVNSSVVGLQDLFETPTLFCQTIGAHLAHSNSMSPTTTCEHKFDNATVVVTFAIDHEELFFQPECRTNTTATNMSSTICADYFQIRYAI